MLYTSTTLQAAQQQSVEDVLAAANALLDNLQSGEPVQSTPGVQASIEELQGLGYVCDESGCVLVLPGDRQQEEGRSHHNVTHLPWQALPGRGVIAVQRKTWQ